MNEKFTRNIFDYIRLAIAVDIKEIIFDQDSLQLDIYIAFKRGSKSKGEGGQEYNAHDTIDRKWQHLNFFQHKCYLHAKVPKIKQKEEKN